MDDFKIDATLSMVGSRRTLEEIKSGTDPKQIVAQWQPELENFRILRARYLALLVFAFPFRLERYQVDRAIGEPIGVRVRRPSLDASMRCGSLSSSSCNSSQS